MRTLKIAGLILSTILIFSACETLRNLPTNTSGGIFSLNGNWKLETTTDNNAQVGTIITVTPALSSAFVKSMENNTYCYRSTDEAWKTIKSLQGGGFTISHLASACNGSTTYKDGEITVVTNDKIKLNAKTISNASLVQEWSRVIK